MKEEFGVAGRTVLFTFGLLLPNKGIERVLNALPAIVAEFPDVVYMVVGATHPNELRERGEAYRVGLEVLAARHRVEEHVIFYNSFVDLDTLKDFIGAADVYITLYLNEAQSTTGTLAYTFGSGKVVVSTPYWHAAELLADGKGVLVQFGNSEAIATGVSEPRKLLIGSYFVCEYPGIGRLNQSLDYSVPRTVGCSNRRVHNAAVVRHDGEYIMLFRSHLRTGRSIVGMAHGRVRIALAKTNDFTHVERIRSSPRRIIATWSCSSEKSTGYTRGSTGPYSEINPWSMDLLLSGPLFLGPVRTTHTTGTIPLGRDEERTGRATHQNGPGLAFHLSRCLPYHEWRRITSRHRFPRSSEPCKSSRSGRFVDPSTRGSVGDYRLRPQRSIHLRRGSGVGWHRQDLLGSGGYGDVRR